MFRSLFRALAIPALTVLVLGTAAASSDAAPRTGYKPNQGGSYQKYQRPSVGGFYQQSKPAPSTKYWDNGRSPGGRLYDPYRRPSHAPVLPSSPYRPGGSLWSPFNNGKLGRY